MGIRGKPRFCMDPKLLSKLKKAIEGDVANDSTTLAEHSHDASLFEMVPQAVVYPKNEKDLEALVAFVNEHKKAYPNLSLT